MLRRIAVAALCFIAPCTGFATVAAPPTIRYVIARQSHEGVDRFIVTMQFRGDDGGRTRLHIPGEWAGAQHAERGIDGLAIIGGNARLVDTEDATLKTVVHRPGATIRVRYVLQQIAEGDPAANAPTQFLPVIRSRYFELIGWMTWVVPYDDDRVVHIHAAFRGFPRNWSFASSFGLDPANVVWTGRLERFRSALFIGGDFRLRSRPARGGPIITAIRGNWSFRDGELADRVAKIIDATRAFWGDDSQRYALVALLPLIAQSGSQNFAGTGLTRSFVTWATPAKLDELDFLWTHEYFHIWNNAQLGQFPEPQPKMFWFSEGFTDYYMNLAQLRLGLMTLKQYAAAYDEALRALSGMPGNRMSNDAVAEHFFTDPQGAGRLPYLRGMLLAARWNAEIIAHSNGAQSLDDAMRELFAQYRSGTTTLDAARIVNVLRSVGVPDAAQDLERFIDRGEIPHLADGTLGRCIGFVDIVDHASDLGFDRSASEQVGHFVGVRVDGPAFAAGIRETQQFRSLNTFGRGRPVEVGVIEPPDQAVRIVRYLPTGQPFDRQSATLADDLDEASKSNCLQTVEASGTRSIRQASP